MVIQTSRFGQVEFQNEDVLTFPEGVLGFADLRKFVLLDDPSDEIFAWLQSCESSEIAFPVLEPEIFSENYKINLTKNDLECLQMKPQDKPHTFCIVTIPDDPTQMTANMKAPIVINTVARVASQCVLQDNQLAIREPLFAKLQQRVVQFPTQSIKNQFQGMDVAVKIAPEKAKPGSDIQA